MSDLVALTLAASATVAATGLGALPVIALGSARTRKLHAAVSGFAAGAMAVAAVTGLLVPGISEGGALQVAAGALAGVCFLMVVRRRVGRAAPGSDRGWLVVAIVLFAHSVPEGLAIGTAYGSQTEGLALFVVLAIALQNVPEGTATALPLQAAGHGPAAQIGTAILTSAPQLPGALLAHALVESVEPRLPVSFGFAAGAMPGRCSAAPRWPPSRRSRESEAAADKPAARCGPLRMPPASPAANIRA